jgi:DNA-binding MarR family transcriptional regulator
MTVDSSDPAHDQVTDGRRLVRELSTAVVLLHEAIGTRLGLNAADHKALGIIDRDGPLAPSELATRLGLTRPAVTAMVDRLEHAGHLRRSPDHTDRRRVALRLSDDRDPALAQTYAALDRALSQGLAGYTTTEQDAILSFLATATATLRTQTQRLSAAPPVPRRLPTTSTPDGTSPSKKTRRPA